MAADANWPAAACLQLPLAELFLALSTVLCRYVGFVDIIRGKLENPHAISSSHQKSDTRHEFLAPASRARQKMKDGQTKRWSGAARRENRVVWRIFLH